MLVQETINNANDFRTSVPNAHLAYFRGLYVCLLAVILCYMRMNENESVPRVYMLSEMHENRVCTVHATAFDRRMFGVNN